MKRQILLSVVMLCYNHEDYVRKAIEGVIRQKTNFGFEVLIHDDASTDNSINFIKEYENTYPELVKGIYQKENQYSKNINIWKSFINPIIQGKYIAVCECDDYWCDDNKLQKQVDFLEKHPQFSGTAHNCYFIDKDGNETPNIYDVYRPYKSHIFTLKRLSREVVYPGQTASFVYRSSATEFTSDEQEKDFNNLRTKVGDTKRNLQLLLNGDIFCFEEKMSAYRIVTNKGDSWSAKNYGKNLSDQHYIISIDMRKYIKKYCGITFANYYTTFHAGVAGAIKFIVEPNEENKRVFRKICGEHKNMLSFLAYLVIVGFKSIPLVFLRKIEKIKYDL